MPCSLWPPIKKEEYKGVWVYLEREGDRLKDVGLELLGKARDLAQKLGGAEVGGVIVAGTEEMAREAIYHGADKVVIIDNPELKIYTPKEYAEAIATVVQKYKPEIFLIGATKRGRELAAYIANTLTTGITADCTALEIDPKTRDLMQIRPTFGGTQLATIKTPQRRPQMASVRPGVFPKPPRDTNRTGEIIIEKVEVTRKTRLISVEKRLEKDVADLPPVESADVVVAGGRGLGSADGFKLLIELAKLLGGTVGASLMAVRAGWAPHTRQIGQTGKTIRPRLYIAVGISGAIQHLMGILEAKTIVAINPDPHAPIMENADYAVVGDYKQIIPLLIEEIKRLKNQQ
ncbi:electron transfer flavoprotein, alpha subunit [Pyrobaculum islandicum DSM 4184]|uniref:Electron transfer flavoprotein, alpha subunit n=1 Tax=Pyrobaculum islandicum (strain DSM 4184 / JCM 9189 / GEO3) TaxID=384616 RepID=A1RS91_PYRIL|nr:electron transfer flavoprotein subunit alpha/FixB family protein [Pyrobaculum islandicum]ABL87823.1 electron transfer flavoprotein, alpha subunit [Pyrobaculum islandicum DSM 4184]